MMFRDVGRSVTKSVVGCDHGLCGLSSGRSFPATRVQGMLAWVQMDQEDMNW